MQGHRASTKTTKNYDWLFATALVFARLASQARSKAAFQAAVIFLFCLGF
jgi:hypothetical protein